MNKFLGLSSIIVLALVAVVLFAARTNIPFLVAPSDAGTLTSLQQGTEDEVPPQETDIPTLEPEPLGTVIYYEPEQLPTEVPPPTAPPTPVVTRVPVTTWPAIPDTDGEQMPYTIYYANDEAISTIAISATDGTQQQDSSANLREITGLYLADIETMWWGDVSPNGQQIALVMSNQEMPSRGKREDGNRIWSIYLYDVATKSVERLVDNGLYPKWSNDGSRIAYFNLSTRSLGIINVNEKSAMDIFALQTDPENDMSLESELNWFTWSPDDQFIAMVQTFSSFANSGGIWIVDSSTGKDSRQLADMEMYAGATQWSPAGNQVLFPSSRGSVPDINLWLLDTQSGDIRQLTSDMNILDAIWSTDGSAILLSGMKVHEGEQESYDLWLLAPETGEIRRLTDDPSVHSYNLQWTPDATRAIFNRFAKDDRDLGLWELDLSSGELHQVIESNPGYWMLR
jgi:Tol biopolymer transport system component